jgi:predicted ester cyclase
MGEASVGREAHHNREEQDMTDLLTTAREMLALSDANELAAFAAGLHPEVEWVMPDGALSGPAAVTEHLKTYRSAVPDGRHVLTRTLCHADTVVAEGYWTGTNTGVMPTPQGDLPPTGNTVTVPFLAALTFDGDLVRSGHIYFDRLLFLAQLGLLPEAAIA